MSSGHEMYLGGYIVLPHGTWEEIAHKLEIDEDEFIPVINSQTLISNYSGINQFEEHENFIIELNPQFC